MTNERRERRFHKRLGIRAVRYERFQEMCKYNLAYYIESALFWIVVTLMSLLCLGVAER